MIQKIRNSDIKISKIYNMFLKMEDNGVDFKDVIKLLAIIINELEPFDESERKVYIEDIINILRYRLEKVKYLEAMEIFQEFEILRRLEFRKERYGIEKLLKELKDISIIEMDRFECKINEKIKEFTLYTGIVIDSDHGLIYNGVVIINYNYEFNFL